MITMLNIINQRKIETMYSICNESIIGLWPSLGHIFKKIVKLSSLFFYLSNQNRK